jgi:hypothetical protein
MPRAAIWVSTIARRSASRSSRPPPGPAPRRARAAARVGVLQPRAGRHQHEAGDGEGGVGEHGDIVRPRPALFLRLARLRTLRATFLRRNG